MLLGARIKDGKIESVKGKAVGELLTDDACVLIVDDRSSSIYIWVGQKANVKDKFMISRLAHGINGKLFGMAGTVTQHRGKIKELFSDRIFDGDIPAEHTKNILG